MLHDQLYPPLNRAEANVVANRALPRRSPPDGRTEDSFRLLGYLKSTDTDADNARDAGNNVWKCMGRMKDRHTGEFYAVPANHNEDLKIPLTPDIMVSERLKDTYTMPSEMRFNSPFFNAGIYTFVELPKSDLTSPTYV